MPDFAYVARNLSGDRVTGSVSAGSEREVQAMLGAQGLFPVSISGKEEKASISLLGGRVNGQTMANFYFQMAALLRAGVPLLRSIRILRDQTANKSLKKVLADIHDRIEDGQGLGDAMARHPKVFNDIAVNMARAGAEGGFLEDALDRVSKFTEMQNDLTQRTTGALIYPVILATAGTVIVSVLVIYFVPKFAEMFDQLRRMGELPWMTDALLNFSETIQRRGLWILAALIAIGLTLFFQLRTVRGKRMIAFTKLRMPLFGEIFQALSVARFCRVLGTLLHNGVPILKSLEISRQATGNVILSDAIAAASENITSGESLAKPLGKSGYFPKSVVEMIAVAEESNSLDTVLVDVADGLENRTARKLDLLVRMIEPAMLLLMAGAVLTVVIALLLPVIKMSSTIR
ncbi:MAG: type II secretion system F family protein [Planctomycetales bacterium]|nr:type II secretion system F family protein [Planctomycetales bacterium]